MADFYEVHYLITVWFWKKFTFKISLDISFCIGSTWYKKILNSVPLSKNYQRFVGNWFHVLNGYFVVEEYYFSTELRSFYFSCGSYDNQVYSTCSFGANKPYPTLLYLDCLYKKANMAKHNFVAVKYWLSYFTFQQKKWKLA